ncbi:MAG: hypothetical protein QM784_31805 [Polyangiaceae bacterium]
MELAPEEVRAVYLDVHKVIIRVMAAAKRLPHFEAELRALQGFRVERLERLPDYALALYSAHNRYRFPASKAEPLPVLYEAATKRRNALLAEARSLVERSLIKAELLKALVGHHGYRNVAHDLAGLAHIFAADWERLQEHTSLKRAELESVGQLALRLTGALAMRKRTPEETKAAKDIQLRMFTLLSRAYNEIRQGIQYLRRDRHVADEIVPSLYSGRRRHSKPSDVEKEHLRQTTPLSNESITRTLASPEAGNEGNHASADATGPRVPVELIGDPLTYNSIARVPRHTRPISKFDIEQGGSPEQHQQRNRNNQRLGWAVRTPLDSGASREST